MASCGVRCVVKFFVPGTENEGEAEELYENVRRFAVENCGPVTDRRISSIDFRDRGQLLHAQVGEVDPITGEMVIVILETPGNQPYLVCTPNRGVLRGMPVLVGKGKVRVITDFD